MICSNCNKEIREGATYCEECGAAIDEPIVIKDIKQTVKQKAPKEKENLSDPFFDFSGYVKSLGESPVNLLGLVGGVILYLAPFLTWQWMSFKSNKIQGDLFDLAGKNHDMGLGEGVLTVFAILLILAGISMIIISAEKYIRLLKPFSDNFILRIAPLVMGVVLLVLITRNEAYMSSLDGIKEQIKEFNIIGSDSLKGGQGIGFFANICGVLLYGVSVVMAWLGEKK